MKRETPNSFFSALEEGRIIDAIGAAERRSSGEIRVHLERRCRRDPLERAREVFEFLDMDSTQARNGVLFYVATVDRVFAVIGDEGIHRLVSDDFWIDVAENLANRFRSGEFAEGLLDAIARVASSLEEHFPSQGPRDVNELPNSLSEGPDAS